MCACAEFIVQFSGVIFISLYSDTRTLQLFVIPVCNGCEDLSHDATKNFKIKQTNPRTKTKALGKLICYLLVLGTIPPLDLYLYYQQFDFVLLILLYN